MNKQIDLASMYSLFAEQLESGGEVTFEVHGTSMRPLFRRDGDFVVLKKPTLPLKKYDIPFYRRSDGSFVLHRVIKVTPGGYVCRGDGQFVSEKGVTDGMIIGVATHRIRDGVRTPLDSPEVKRYAVLRVASAPIRRILRRQ